MFRPCFCASSATLTGALIVILVVYMNLLESRPDLAVWHLADLDFSDVLNQRFSVLAISLRLNSAYDRAFAGCLAQRIRP
jgi:hypothetical protein